MRVSWFTKMFPPPNFLAAPAIGLDISDRSIKFSRLELHWQELVLTHFGEKPLPIGLIEAGQIRDQRGLTEILRGLADGFPTRRVAVSLPEEQAYMIKLHLPAMRMAELRSSIELQLEEHVPLPVTEAIFDYELMDQNGPDNGYELSVAVLPKNVVVGYLTAVQDAGLDPTAFEVEAQAIVRAVIPRAETGTHLVIDFGKTRTSFFIARGGAVLFTSTVKSVGGEDINKAIEKNLGVDYATAEKLKIERGLLPSRQDPRLLQAVLPIVSVLRDETATLYNYWQTHASEHDRAGRPVSRIVLSGGQATLPGLTAYLGANLPVPVSIADVWTNILDCRRTVPPIDFNNAFKYTTSLGLALRSFPNKM